MQMRTVLLYLGVVDDPDRLPTGRRIPTLVIGISTAVAIVLSNRLAHGFLAQLAISMAIGVGAVLLFALANRLMHRRRRPDSGPS